MRNTKESGITLIALIITIIVLLILAGVSIAMVVGDNGVLGQAINATVATDIADTKEQIEVALVGYLNDSGEYTTNNVKSAVQEVLGDEASITENDDGTYTVTTEKENVVDITDIMNNAIAVISTEESFVGYYADVDGDGSVDGVIYVDLMHEQTAEIWDSTDLWIVLTEGVKDYCISQENYIDDFGTADVISLVNGSTGNDRFYVMTLDDFTTDSYSRFFWYYAAYSYGMSDYSTATSIDFGTGKENTETMISYWNTETYGSQNAGSGFVDIWGVIQDEVDKGWFVPSAQEWDVFYVELGIDIATYESEFNLFLAYWTSSQLSEKQCYRMSFNMGAASNGRVDTALGVRLSTTF